MAKKKISRKQAEKELDNMAKSQPKVYKEISLAQLYEVYKSRIYLEDTKRIDIFLASALSSKLEGIAIWVILVGASGDAKSMMLNSLMGLRNVYVLNNLTSKTLVNGYKDKEEYPDLAPELHNKIILIPDMAQILKLPAEEKAELWGQLRDLYDGFAGKVSGQGSRARYEGIKTTLLAASTPAIDSQILVHQDLGTRELIYRIEENQDKDKLMNTCFENEEFEKQIKEELRETTEAFIETRKITRIDIAAEVLEEIKKIALYTSYMRATAEFDNYNNELRNKIYPEQPTRILKQLKRIFICLKSLSDDYTDSRALEILWHLGKSSAFPIRAKLYDFLKETTAVELSTSQLSELFKIGKGTIKRECLALENMGLISCRRQETSYPDKFYEYWTYKKDNPLELVTQKRQDLSDNHIYTNKIKNSNDKVISIYPSPISLDGLKAEESLDFNELNLDEVKNG